MSGGAFNYEQDSILRIISEIEHEIATNNVEDEYLYAKNYSDHTIAAMRSGVKQLKLAYHYARRIDWLLSGDDGEDDFVRRLLEEWPKECDYREVTK